MDPFLPDRAYSQCNCLNNKTLIKSLLCVGQHSKPWDKAENKTELTELTLYSAIHMNKLIKHLLGASEEGPGPSLWREDPGRSGLGDTDTGTLIVGARVGRSLRQGAASRVCLSLS